MEIKKQYIYRVEDSYGEGCYTTSNEHIRKHAPSNGHPRPQEDDAIDRLPKHFEKCGLLNLNQVMAWFTTAELGMLEDDGFYLKRIKVLVKAIGNTQVLFDSRFI